MKTLDKNYWTQRYQSGETQWDIGKVSTPLKEYFDQLKDKEIKILIPGCGNAYEGKYLHEQGFKNVYLIDIAEEPIAQFAANNPDFPKEHLLVKDYFELEEKFDLIIEQTFFCALGVKERERYCKKTAELLKEKGKLVGLLFASEFEKAGPPFGGTKEEYEEMFGKYFKIEKMESAYNSIPPRAGNELFIKMAKQIV